MTGRCDSPVPNPPEGTPIGQALLQVEQLCRVARQAIAQENEAQLHDAVVDIEALSIRLGVIVRTW